VAPKSLLSTRPGVPQRGIARSRLGRLHEFHAADIGQAAFDGSLARYLLDAAADQRSRAPYINIQ
jgi:hypothetical protein